MRSWQYWVAGLLSAGIANGCISTDAIAVVIDRSLTNSVSIDAASTVSSYLPSGYSLSTDSLNSYPFNTVIAMNGDPNESLGEDLVVQGRQLYHSGQFSAAVNAWQQTVENTNDVLTQAIVSSYLSLAYQELNQWDLAQTAIERSVMLLENKEAVEAAVWGQVLNTRAGLVYHLGQAEQALELWEQAEDFYVRADDLSGQLGSQINQAQALQSLGFYRRSRQQLETVADQLSDMPDSELKINGLRTLGNALQVLG
ncbi:MAG: tetratricopeptide repeat protein, partial [Cyanobacteria bacterium J06650_10]